MTILEYYDIMCRKTDFTFRGWLKMDRTKWKVLDRGMIKYIAMFTMLLNHISTIFMESGNFLSELFLDVGYFTAIIMCYFLVEGYQYTHSKKKYGYRLMAFALISEIPYCLAFTKNGILEFRGLNMIFTLLICFCIILTAEKVKNIVWKVLFISMLILLCLISDWALLAPIFTLLFIWANGSRKKVKVAFIISIILFGLFNFVGGIGRFSVNTNILYALGSIVGMALAAITILYFYNGKQMKRGKAFSKWFFYWFYPVHLLVLGIIRVSLL